MSFSVDTKNEVANLETGSKSSNLSELAALVRTNATITISFRDELTLKFATESSPTARRIFRIIKSLYAYDSEIRVTRNDQLRKKSFYILHINDEEISRFLLEDTGFDPSLFALDSVMNPDKNFYPASIVDKRAFLRGAFLGAGSVTDPNKTYHLEIVVNSEQTGNLLIDISKAVSYTHLDVYKRQALTGVRGCHVYGNEVFGVFRDYTCTVTDFFVVGD